MTIVIYDNRQRFLLKVKTMDLCQLQQTRIGSFQ